MRCSTGIVLIAAALAPCPRAGATQAAPPAEGPVVVDDFEAPELGRGWTSSDAELRLVPEGPGHALEIAGRGQMTDSRPRAGVTLPVKDLRRIGSVAFRIEAVEGPMDLQLFLRKGETFRTLEEILSLEKREWQEVVLPLRLMVGGTSGLLPDPCDLDRFEIQWQGKGGVFRIDDLRLLPGDRGEDSWRLSEEDLLELAFGKGHGRIHRGKHFSLLANSSLWETPEASRFLADIEQGSALLESWFSVQAPPGTRIPIVCTTDQMELTNSHPALLGAFHGNGLFPGNVLNCGFMPYAEAYQPPGKGSVGKPGIFGISEYIGTALRVHPNSSIARSLYLAYERRVSPESFRGGPLSIGRVKAVDFQNLLLGKPTLVPPWSQLFDPDKGYQQAGALLTVPEFLAAGFRAKLPKIWDAVRSLERDPDHEVMEAIARALDTTSAKLEDQWAHWGASTWK